MAKKYLGQMFFIVTRKEGNKERKSNMILSPQKICPFKTNIIKVQFFFNRNRKCDHRKMPCDNSIVQDVNKPAVTDEQPVELEK
jgi:hypothetical protein